MKTKVKTFAQSLLSNEIYEKGRRTFHKVKPLPDFLIIGTQKGGTTSLYHYLTSHPQIFQAAKKEIYFFDYKFSKGLRWYRRHFPLICRMKQGAVTGEASPGYLYYPHTAKRIASITPDVKLVVLLRNPVARAISHYWHEVKDGWEDLSMRKAFDMEEERLKEGEKKVLADNVDYSFAHKHFSYLDRGKYAKQIGAFYKYFDRDQILILKSENLFSKTRKVFDKTVRFLGLNPYSISDFEPHNVGRYLKETNPNLSKELEEYFQPYNELLYKLLDRNLGW